MNFFKSVVLLITLLCSASAMAQTFPATAFSSLDYGIYWYSNKNTAIKGTGAANANFDKTKPTVIYVHGWQKDTVAILFRETYEFAGNTGTVDLVTTWKNKGWNVGIFYWNQFSDEGEVRDAQAKVWDANGGQYKMRWRKSDGTYPATPVISVSASQLFYDEIVKAMAGYTGADFRIAGHSLGNQMAIAVTEKLSDANTAGTIVAALVPKRVALLDPAYLKADAKWLGGVAASAKADAALTKVKARGVIFETLRSSAASDSFGLIGDSADFLVMKKTAFREMRPWYFSATQIAEKHGAAVWTYFWEMAMVQQPIKTGGLAPSASATNAATKVFMDGTLTHGQDYNALNPSYAGCNTKTPADNIYYSVAR